MKLLIQAENELFLKYGYEMEDFEGHDNRTLLDERPGTCEYDKVLRKYFAEPLRVKFIGDVMEFDRLRGRYNELVDAVEKFIGQEVCWDDEDKLDDAILSLMKRKI